MKIQFTLLLCLVALSTICSQTTLTGSITDAKTGEPLMYAYVVIYNQEGGLVTGGQTDIAGDYYIKDLNAGTYDLVFRYVGYEEEKVENVELKANSENYIDGILSPGVELPMVFVIAYNSHRRCGGYCCRYRLPEYEKPEVKVSIKYPGNTIYPNPASSYFNIKSERKIKDASIFNLSGQLIKTLSKGQTQVDVSDLIAGTYFLVITEGKTVQTEKIVIVRD